MVPAFDPDARDPDEPDADAPERDESGAAVLIPAPPPARLGTGTFTIEGRSAPALFVVGWLATIVGIGLIAVGIMSSNPDSARILIVVGLIPLSVGLIAGAGSQAIERRVRGRLPYQGPSPFLVLFASVPISLLAVLAVSVPLAFVGVPLDGPFGALVSVTVQAAVYIGLVRLLVVDAGALDWAAMGVSRPDRRAVAEGLGGAAWALPIVFVTGSSSRSCCGPSRSSRSARCPRPGRTSASPCRSWPGSWSRPSARRSSSGHSPRRPGSAVSASPAASCSGRSCSPSRTF